MKKIVLTIVLLIVVLFLAVYFLDAGKNKLGFLDERFFGKNTELGGDVDDKGCKTSAGYSWCDDKQKCIRPWEEVCDLEAENEIIAVAVKEHLIQKYGENAALLNVTVQKIEGLYAEGGASEIGMGGGMWIAAKVNGEWKLVWDGNGIITCDDVNDYPGLPVTMVPQCFNKATGDMVAR